MAAIAEDFEAGEARFEKDEGFRETLWGGELRIRPCQGARDDTFMEVLKARVRLREREVRKRREERMRKDAALQKRESGQKITTVDLMVNSPKTGDENRFPSPSLPRASESVQGSPVIGTPSTTPVIQQRKESVTVSGPEPVAEEEEKEEKENGSEKCVRFSEEEVIIDSPVLVKKEPGSPDLVVDKEELESPIPSAETTTIKNEPENPVLMKKTNGTAENGTAGLGIEAVGVVVNGE